jgi:hypothetical protein
MGILNVTPDSFSDGGQFLDKPEAALDHAAAMLAAGAAVIDVGGESTRPNAAAVWEGDEIKRVVPVIERLAAMGAAISIDSRRSSVIAAALAAGAHIVNDVSALRHDPRSLEIVAASGAPVVLMHAPAGRTTFTPMGITGTSCSTCSTICARAAMPRWRRDCARQDPARSRHRLWQDAGRQPGADQRLAAVSCAGPADPVCCQPQAHDRRLVQRGARAPAPGRIGDTGDQGAGGRLPDGAGA